MTVLTTLVNDPVPPVVLLETSPITPPLPGTQLVTTLQWNNLLDLIRGTSVDEIDRTALEVMTINRAAVSDATGHLDVSVTTLAELALLTGLTENVQTSLNAKELSANKGAVSGYAGLDAAQELLLANFPTGTGSQVLRRNAGNTALEFFDLTLTLDSLTDTTITAPAAHESLVRNAGNTAWVNELIDNLNLAVGTFGNITGLGTQTQIMQMGAFAIQFNSDTVAPPANSEMWIANEFGTLWSNVGTGSQHDFAVNGSSTMSVEAGQVDFHFNDLVLVDSYQFGNDSTLPGTSVNYIQFGTTPGLVINAGTQDLHLSRSGNNKFSVGNTINDFHGQKASNLGETRLLVPNTAAQFAMEANHTTPANGQTMALMDFDDDNSIGIRHTYAQISALIEDPTSTAEDGELFFKVIKNGSLANFISLNNANGDDITLHKPLFMSDQAVSGVSQIAFQNTTMNIDGSGASFLTANVGAGEFFVVNVNSTNEYFFSNQEIDMQGNWLTDAGRITMLAGNIEYAKGADIASPAGGIMTVPQDGNVFDVTGTNTINEIAAASWQAGSVIHLQFDGILTVTHNSGGTNDILLDGATNMTTAAGDVLTLFYNGVDWQEISRSAAAAGGSGDVVGPASATDQAVALFDSTTGKLIKNSDLVYDFATTKQLTMPGPIILSAAGTVPAGTNTYLREDGSDLDINVTGLGNIFLQFGGTQNYDFDQDRADFLGNNLINAVLTSASTLNATTVSAGLTYNNGIKQTFNPSGANAGLNVGADASDSSAPVNGDIIYNSTTNKFRGYENGGWADLLGGGEFFGPMTAAHDYAGFNIEFKTASPITLGQGATNVLSAIILDDTVDAGFEVKNTDGFVSITNDSAVAGEFYGNLTMKSGGATTATHNIMTFQVPSTQDTGETPYLIMNFEDDIGGAAGRPLMAINAGATEFVRIDHTTAWTFHTSTSFTDINSIKMANAITTSVGSSGFVGVALALDLDDMIAWDGATASTPDYIGFDGGTFKIGFDGAAPQYQFLATQADGGGAFLSGWDRIQFTSGGTNNLTAIAGGLVADVDASDSFFVDINSATEYEFDASFFKMNQNWCFDSKGFIDENSKQILDLPAVGVTSAVNYFHMENAATGVGPLLTTLGSDTNVDLRLSVKGTTSRIRFVEDTAAMKQFQMSKGADIASTGAITPTDGNYFDITGTTTVNHMVNDVWEIGSVITLQFDAALTLTHNAGAPPGTTVPFSLKGGINMTTAAGDTITVVNDGAFWREISRRTPQTPGFTMVDAEDIVLATGTGTKIGTATTQKLAFFNSTPVVQPTAITTVLTTLTSAGPGTPDYAIQAATSTTPFGFVTADEMETVLTVIINNQARINDLESKLQALGLLA